MRGREDPPSPGDTAIVPAPPLLLQLLCKRVRKKQEWEPTVSSSEGDRGAVDRDRHRVVLAAVEVMLILSLRNRRGRGGR